MAIRLSGLASGMDTESMVEELMKAQRLKATKIENKITKAEWKQEKWKSLNTKLYSFYTDSLSKAKLQGSYNTRKVSSSDETVATVTASSSAPKGTHTLRVEQLASSQFVTGGKLASSSVTGATTLTSLGLTAGTSNTITVDAGGVEKSLTISDTTTVSEFTNMLKSAGLNASYDTKQQRFFISSKDSGYKNAFSLSASSGVDLSKLGLGTITKTENTTDGSVTVGGTSNMTIVSPKDAKLIYNDLAMTSSSNTVTANGLTFSLKSITSGFGTDTTADDQVISLNVEDDKKAVYDMVKSFVTKYNELLKEMNTAYYAASASEFDPLTDDEKEAMTEDEIEKWETKIKDSLLKRDNNINSLLTNMRSTLAQNVSVNGKNYALSSFGIKTMEYTEKGILHINGDSDDSLVSGLDNDLMEALEEDPDKVMQVLSTLSGKLYTSFTKSMSSTSLRSAMTFYNDKELTKSIKTYKDDLTKMEDKLSALEERYYKQFSAMETAMQKMNSQSSSLASLLGSGN